MNKIEELQKRFEEEMKELISNDPELQKIIRDEEERISQEDYKRKIMNFLKELKEADERIAKIFVDGSCYKLCKILKVIYPNSKALYSIHDGHWISQIGNEYYDINGRIKKEYVIDKDYKEHPEFEASANIITHTNNIGTSYNKYAET